MFQDSSIKICKFCGEFCSGAFCVSCKTKEQRKDKIVAQLSIEKQRGIVTEQLFGVNRERLLKEYNIKYVG